MVSHKPAWLLASEAALASLNEEQRRTQEQLRQLRCSLNQFDELTQRTTTEPPVSEDKSAAPHEWPVDVFRCVSKYLEGDDMIRYGECSRGALDFLEKNDDFFAAASRGLEKWPVEGLFLRKKPKKKKKKYQSLVTTYSYLVRQATSFRSGRCESTVDGRRRTLQSLRALNLVTAFRHGDFLMTAPHLGDLLENVDTPSAIHELAAGALANLLASGADCSRATVASLRCLLTSPAARVATTSVRTHTYCQGVACKQAARALCNLFDPLNALTMPPEDAFPRTSDGEFPSSVDLVLTIFHASGGRKSQLHLTLELEKKTADILVDGRGHDDQGHTSVPFRLHGTADVDVYGHLVIRFALTYDDQDERAPEETAGNNIRRLVLEHQFLHHLSSGHIALLLWQGEDLLTDGLFGVWEICSPSNCFVLRRGGVCRGTVLTASFSSATESPPPPPPPPCEEEPN